MRTLLLAGVLNALVFTAAFASGEASQSDSHRYLIERTFPAGALDGVDASVKKKVNDNNATLGVKWIRSFTNEPKTKTYCVYEGPSEAAVRQAAKLNGLPVDHVMEVPVETGSAKTIETNAAKGNTHRFIALTGDGKTLDGKARAQSDATNSRFGVKWITSYADAGTCSAGARPRSGTPMDSAIFSSHSSVWRFISMVREALVTSV